MSKFTPGPWKLNKWGQVVTEDGAFVCSSGLSLSAATAEHKANDALIAASPDMYAALTRAATLLVAARDLVRKHAPDATVFYDDAECDGYCLAEDCNFLLEDAVAALAKAERGQP